MSTFGFARRLAARIVPAVLLAQALVPGAAAGPGNPSSAQEPPAELQPVQIVVLVDESGSLSPEDVARERDAARVLVQGEPSPESTVSVVGFASADASGQSPVDPVCRPTKLNTPQNRQFLADCIGELRRRTPAEGEGTDHVNALREALGYLSAPGAADQPKIVYLLTDGKLDVSKSPAYGNNPDDRNAAARQQIPGLLDELNRAGVQVWPLGFGKADQAQLNGFATGAAQDRCGFTTPPPRARMITGSADLLGAIRDASRAARCTSVGEPVTDELPADGSVDLEVDVPAIASEGSILVFKRDPRVTVSYLDPEGTAVPTNGQLGISRFELSGQGSEAEALRIVNPTPGQWTVRLAAPPGVPDQQVGAIAIFQGAIRATIGVTPLSPTPGSTVEVTMQVSGSRGAITDPAQLADLTFVAELRGEGFAPVPPVELADGDGDGQPQGPLTVPDSATGLLEFVGSVTGIGVSGAERTQFTRVSRSRPDVAGVLSLDGVGTDVVVGTSLSGTANVTNSTGQPRTLRIEVADQSPGTVVAAEPARLTVPASGKAVLPFTVRFDPATALGVNQARLLLVDESDGAQVGELLFSREVVEEPGLPERLWWLWLLLAVALAGGIACVVWWSQRRRAERDVHGVRVELRRHGQSVESPVRAHRHGEEFRFGVRQGDSGADLGLTTGPGGDRYRVRRGPTGPTLHGPSGEPVDLAPNGALELGDGLQMVVHDRPAAGRSTGPVRTKSADGGPGARPRLRYDPDPYSNGGSGGRSRSTEDPYANTD